MPQRVVQTWKAGVPAHKSCLTKNCCLVYKQLTELACCGVVASPGCVTHFRNYASVLDVPRYLRFRKASARLGGALENVMQTSSLKLRNQILDGTALTCR